MPTCHVRGFNEPSEFAAALHGVKVDLTVTSRGRFEAESTMIDLGSLRIHRLSENLPRIMHFDHLGGRAIFSFHTQPGPILIRNGVEVTSENLMAVDERQSVFQQSSGPFSWGTISLPLEEIPALRRAVSGCAQAPSADEQKITPRPDALANLQRLHAAAGSLAKQAPEVIRNPEGARGMEQILKQALAACLDSNDVHEQTATQLRHQKIMERFHAVLTADPSRSLYLLEVATAVGASLRSLTECSQEHLGMGPKRYLVLRRMHLARQALIAPGASVSTVTDVATQYGFWQFGRFAAEYKRLFGELPSVTLRRRKPLH